MVRFSLSPIRSAARPRITAHRGAVAAVAPAGMRAEPLRTLVGKRIIAGTDPLD
jgi:hypothetical protein